MKSRDRLQPEPNGGHLAALQEYRDAVAKLFPGLERRALEEISLSPADALFIGEFLDHCPRGTVVLEVGASAGASAFCFAGHPGVSTIVSIGSNSPAVEELAAAPEHRSVDANLAHLEGLGMLDVACASLAELSEGQGKVQFLENGMGGGLAETLEKTDALSQDGLVVLVRRPRTRDAVTEILRTVLEQNPHAIIFLEDCRGTSGPFVQAGVADFLEWAEREYHFGLVGDLGPGLSGGSLGFVYSKAVDYETLDVLDEVSRSFSGSLDPLWLLQREEDLVETVNRVDRELRQVRQNFNQLQRRSSELEQELKETRESKDHHQSRASHLERHNEHLKAHYSSRRYRLVDALAGRLLRIPGLKRLLRR